MPFGGDKQKKPWHLARASIVEGELVDFNGEREVSLLGGGAAAAAAEHCLAQCVKLLDVRRGHHTCRAL